ncbi:MAG: lytic transglycosylase domain-containing protein [Bdellovibrionales bacterium]|nr:lytic transglycosylase domain-containing protein [Bdellovibrionales bacterium]
MMKFGSLFALANLILGSAAFAAVEPVAPWKPHRQPDWSTVFNDQVAAPTTVFETSVAKNRVQEVLTDPDNRVDQAFKVPRPLIHVSRFWARVYSQWTSQETVIYDSHHPEVIYDVLDHRELVMKGVPVGKRERVIQAALQTRLNQVRQILKKWADTVPAGQKPIAKTALERRVLSALSLSTHSHSLAQSWERVRVQRGLRDSVARGLTLSNQYLRKMEEVFREFDLPVELTRISLVESSFNPEAVSRLGAVGAWQFLEASGREFMTVDPRRGIDERKSPLKSAVAAAKLLARNHKRLGSWPLTVTSYHHGLRGIWKAKREGWKSDRLWSEFDFCNKDSSMGWASQNYYAEFLALSHVVAYQDIFFGNTPVPSTKSVIFSVVPARQSALFFAKKSGLSINEFMKFNPDILNTKQLLPAGFWVVLPVESTDEDLLRKSLRRYLNADRPRLSLLSNPQKQKSHRVN